MKLISVWNTRGLCTRSKRGEIKSFISSSNTSICCLLETKALSHKMKDYVKDCCEGWDAHGNYSCVLKGRIWILWDSAKIKVKIIEESSQHIHCEVEVIQSGMLFRMTAVYAHNYYISRRDQWSKLELIASVNQTPWIVLGDFNAVRSQEERYGYPPNIAQMEEFNSCLSTCALTDLRSVGLNLTWNNKGKPGNLKMAKLDRSLVSEEWLHTCPNSLTEFIPPGISDHSPSLCPAQTTNLLALNPSSSWTCGWMTNLFTLL
ncbi:uncharacterized protein LOC143861421 [Tasmannia lanceolata]|uniref:uncharacterized protein LOC143861421 n=1 Tax=Tasmannia lanceolata TaxID=3420 RepID=UPI004063998F